MTNTLAEFDHKFRTQELAITATDHWRWSLRPVHATLGAGILSLSRFSPAFSDLAPQEAADLSTITKIVEDSLHRSFAYSKINYIMLMMVDSHLHFHVIPRYDRPIEFGGFAWTDSGWPALPALSEDQAHGTTKTLNAIRDHLKDRLPSQ